MKNSKKNKQTDLEKCRDEVNGLLKEYNCELLSADEWHHVLIRDLDTDETLGGLN